MNFGYVIADDGESTGTGGSITGSGTIGYLPAFTGTSSIGNSPIYTTGGSVAIGTATIQATAIFQIDSTSKGFLPPRVTTVQKNQYVFKSISNQADWEKEIDKLNNEAVDLVLYKFKASIIKDASGLKSAQLYNCREIIEMDVEIVE